MAKLIKSVPGDFDAVLNRVTDGILSGSMSASLEDSWDTRGTWSRCAVRVFERYSWTGENRVSMNVTFYQENGGPVQVCAITSGGSQALFFKVNTLGEEAFLDKLREILE